MIKRISIGVVAGATILAGLAGFQVYRNTASAEGAAATTCVLTWGSDPKPVAPSSKKDGVPLTVTNEPNATAKGYINAPVLRMQGKRACSGGDPLEVTWSNYQGSTYIGDLWFLGRTEKTQLIYDADPLGVRTWKGHLEPDADDTDVAFADPAPIDFRLASAAKLASFTFSANCANITFKAVGTRYAAKWNGYVSHTSAPGSIQFRPVDSQSWVDVGTFTTDSAGAATVTKPFPGLGDYRVFINDVPTAWASSSSTRYIEETC